MQRSMQSVETDTMFGRPEGSNFIFQRAEMFVSLRRSTTLQGEREGIVRHQPSVSSPISHYANWRSLQNLVLLLGSHGKASTINQRRYDNLLKSLKRLLRHVRPLSFTMELNGQSTPSDLQD